MWKNILKGLILFSGFIIGSLAFIKMIAIGSTDKIPYSIEDLFFIQYCATISSILIIVSIIWIKNNLVRSLIAVISILLNWPFIGILTEMLKNNYTDMSYIITFNIFIISNIYISISVLVLIIKTNLIESQKN